MQVTPIGSKEPMYKRLFLGSVDRIKEIEETLEKQIQINRQQAATIEQQARIIEKQAAIIKGQAATIQRLETRVAELERMIGLNSRNSSKPPSSEGLRKPVSLRKLGVRPTGGQSGHKGCTLEQVEIPSIVIQHETKVCERCGESLSDQPISRYIKRQVFDIPEPTVEVTEHRAEVRVCTCGFLNQAKFPCEIGAPVQYGSRLKALSVYLSNQQLIPEDRLQQTLEDLFNLSISTATIVKINERFSEKIKLHQEEVLSWLKDSEVKHLDETGLRVGGKTHWLHVICNDLMTHYRVSEKRGNLLQGIWGVMVHDHWKPYWKVPNVQHGLCNAHHLRELKALEEIEKERWAFKMSKLLRILCHATAPPLDRAMRVYDKIVEAGLRLHEKQMDLRSRKKRIGHNLLLRLKNHKDEVLRFATNPSVPFTNNQAEQDIRMMKVKQRISGGFRTTAGADIFCTIRGFLSTQRKQQQNLFQAIQLAIAR